MRRCGKSTLFDIYKDLLIENGVDSSRNMSINFERIEYEPLIDYHALYEHTSERLMQAACSKSSAVLFCG